MKMVLKSRVLLLTGGWCNRGERAQVLEFNLDLMLTSYVLLGIT